MAKKKKSNKAPTPKPKPSPDPKKEEAKKALISRSQPGDGLVSVVSANALRCNKPIGEVMRVSVERANRWVGFGYATPGEDFVYTAPPQDPPEEDEEPTQESQLISTGEDEDELDEPED